jgi:hypothetical protein
LAAGEAEEETLMVVPVEAEALVVLGGMVLVAQTA